RLRILRFGPSVLGGLLAGRRRPLRQSTTQGRAVLQRVLRGRITFPPSADGRGYDFEGPTRFDKLFACFVAPLPGRVRDGDVRGTEHIGPADTPEADYGRLLEGAEQAATGGKGGDPERAELEPHRSLPKSRGAPAGYGVAPDRPVLRAQSAHNAQRTLPTCARSLVVLR